MRDLNHRTREGRPIELGAAPGFPIVAEIAVRNGPISGIAATADGTRLVVTNHGRDSVSVIDTDSCRVVETVGGLGEPFAVVTASADCTRAYVSTVSPAYDSIAAIDLMTYAVVATHPLAFSVSDLAVSPDGRYVYASRNRAAGADVAVLDFKTGRAEAIELPLRPASTSECVRLSADGTRLYVATTSPAGGQLVVVGKSADRWEVAGAVDIGLPIRDVALSPDGAQAYVASCGPDWGAVIDVVDTRTATVAGTYKIGEPSGILTGLTLSRDGDRAYVVSDDSVTVLCTLTNDVVGTLGVANEPSCVLESPNAKYLYLADYSGRLTVAPVASIVALGTGASARTPELV
ncbi:YncE family protein [Mycobacterium palustre]|nr:YncE family protein [Mycobacterium palustre]MCV7102010.1 YncE family protein [Mycobacterium palustre]